MPIMPKTAELVTDNPKVTDCDGLQRLNWLCQFRAVHTVAPVTIRHPSLSDEKTQFDTSSALRRAAALVSSGPCASWSKADRRELAEAIAAEGLSGENDLDNHEKLLAAHKNGVTTNGYALESHSYQARALAA